MRAESLCRTLTGATWIPGGRGPSFQFGWLSCEPKWWTGLLAGTRFWSNKLQMHLPGWVPQTLKLTAQNESTHHIPVITLGEHIQLQLLELRAPRTYHGELVLSCSAGGTSIVAPGLQLPYVS